MVFEWVSAGGSKDGLRRIVRTLWMSRSCSPSSRSFRAANTTPFEELASVSDNREITSSLERLRLAVLRLWRSRSSFSIRKSAETSRAATELAELISSSWRRRLACSDYTCVIASSTAERRVESIGRSSRGDSLASRFVIRVEISTSLVTRVVCTSVIEVLRVLNLASTESSLVSFPSITCSVSFGGRVDKLAEDSDEQDGDAVDGSVVEFLCSFGSLSTDLTEFLLYLLAFAMVIQVRQALIILALSFLSLSILRTCVGAVQDG